MEVTVGWVTLRVIASAQHSLCDGPVPFLVPVSETWLGWQPTAVVLLYCLKKSQQEVRDFEKPTYACCDPYCTRYSGLRTVLVEEE